MKIFFVQFFCVFLLCIQLSLTSFKTILLGCVVTAVISGFIKKKKLSKLVSLCVVAVQSLHHVQPATPWTAAHQASLSIAISQSLLELLSIESVMPSNHLVLCRPLLLLPSNFPSIRVFSNESVLCIRWLKVLVSV